MVRFETLLRALVTACSGRNDSSPRIPAKIAKMNFRPYQVIDKMQGGLVVGTYAVPDKWNAVSSEQRWSDLFGQLQTAGEPTTCS